MCVGGGGQPSSSQYLGRKRLALGLFNTALREPLGVPGRLGLPWLPLGLLPLRLLAPRLVASSPTLPPKGVALSSSMMPAAHPPPSPVHGRKEVVPGGVTGVTQ